MTIYSTIVRTVKYAVSKEATMPLWLSLTRVTVPVPTKDDWALVQVTSLKCVSNGKSSSKSFSQSLGTTVTMGSLLILEHRVSACCFCYCVRVVFRYDIITRARLRNLTV